MKSNRTLGKFLEYIILRVIVSVFSTLPFVKRRQVFCFLVNAFAKLTGVGEKRILDNLRRVFPEKDPAELAVLVDQNLRSIGYMANEFCEEPDIDDAWCERWVELLPDRATHKQILDRGGILVMGHLGNWEMMGVSMTRSTTNDLYVFAKRQSNPWSNAWIERNRATQRIQLIYTDESPRRAIDLIKKGRIVTFIADQNAGPGSPFFPFLGRLASTFQGPALFARITKAPVMFGVSYRTQEGRLAFHIENFEVPSFDPGSDPEAWDREFTYRWVQRLEELVQQHPADYFWLHRRWRTQPEDPQAVWAFWASWEAERQARESA